MRRRERQMTRTIRLEKPGAKRAGVFRRGVDYQVGETYEGVELTPELADRLIAVKGFVEIDAPARQRDDDEPIEPDTEG